MKNFADKIAQIIIRRGVRMQRPPGFGIQVNFPASLSRSFSPSSAPLAVTEITAIFTISPP
jgi:hypothetical protein